MYKTIEIFDSKNNSLIDLSILIIFLDKIDKNILSGDWFVRDVYAGYGKIVNEIECKLESTDEVKVNRNNLFSKLSESEYFFNAKFYKKSSQESFGIIDSAFLYYTGKEKNIISLDGFFSNTKIE